MTSAINNISILGAGAWGTALAQVLAEAGRSVTIYARSPYVAERINSQRRNLMYLPNTVLNAKIRATDTPRAAAEGADLVLLSVPAQHLRGTLQDFARHLPRAVPLVNCAKGIEIETGLLLSEVVAEAVPGHPYAVLSGPSFAEEAARGLPTAVTLATTASEETARLWAEALHGRAFRPYISPDPVGAEVGGALKNVVAIACGIVEGKGLGQNARAAVMTRGMAEIKRFGVMKGALPETFLGLSGLGDLTLTCHSMTSRNFSLGHALGQGQKLEDLLAARPTVSEGVPTARAVARHAEKMKLEMPICRAVDAVLHDGADIEKMIAGLLSRALKKEAA